jgi:hypothetical protein
LRATIYERDTIAPAKDPENGFPLHDPQVTPASQLQSSSYGITGYGSNDRLGCSHTTWTHRTRLGHVRIKAVDCAQITPGYGFEISSGAKVTPFTIQHGRKQAVVPLKIFEGLDKLCRCFPVYGISALGSIDDDRADHILFFHQNFHVCILHSWINFLIEKVWIESSSSVLRPRRKVILFFKKNQWILFRR